MITEDYCSYEVAKLLKEKGFDGESYGIYIDENTFEELDFKSLNNPETSIYRIVTPTHQMAMKWLRDEKNILIYVYPVIDLPIKNNYTFCWRWDGKKKRHDAPHIGDKHNYESFEEAIEAALKYSLENLI